LTNRALLWIGIVHVEHAPAEGTFFQGRSSYRSLRSEGFRNGGLSCFSDFTDSLSSQRFPAHFLAPAARPDQALLLSESHGAIKEKGAFSMGSPSRRVPFPTGRFVLLPPF
jgi:hypothetical protein